MPTKRKFTNKYQARVSKVNSLNGLYLNIDIGFGLVLQNRFIPFFGIMQSGESPSPRSLTYLKNAVENQILQIEIIKGAKHNKHEYYMIVFNEEGEDVNEKLLMFGDAVVKSYE